MFQDENVHYTNGDLYRRENIKIFDDVTLVNPDANQVDKYKDGNVKFGTKGSSVRKTSASSNGNQLVGEDGKMYQPYN